MMSNTKQANERLSRLKHHESFYFNAACISIAGDSEHECFAISQNAVTRIIGTENVINSDATITTVKLTFAEVMQILQELPMLSARNRNWNDDFNDIYLSVSTTGELYFERVDRTYLGKANHIPGVNLHDDSWYVCNLYKTNYDNYECSED